MHRYIRGLQISFIPVVWIASNAWGAGLECVGAIDPGASYHLSGDPRLENGTWVTPTPLTLSYSDNDGFHFETKLTPTSITITPLKTISIAGQVDGGTMRLDAVYQADGAVYVGELQGQGNMGEGIDAEMSCRLQP